MPIASSEIQWFNPASVSDATPAQNGGRPSQVQNVGGVKNNLFPDSSLAQRAAGVEHWRKAFILIKNAANQSLIDPKISIESGTPGDSYTLIYPATWTDTEATRTGRPYGYGTLASAAAASDTSITVTSEADFSGLTDKPFQVGDLIRIDARADVTAEGLSEYAEIDSVTYDGDELTIGLVAGLANSYDAGVHVASVIAPADFAAAVADMAVAGDVTYDDTAYPIAVPQIGSIYQTWTVTVTDAAAGALSVAGDTLGQIASGAQGVNLAPTNPNGGVYFTLDADGWGGAAADGDALTFTTIPAGAGIWYQRVVPPGANAIASDPVAVCVEGESAG
jgi:hypothetical protein